MVTNFIFPNDNVEWISWKYSKDDIGARENIKVAVAAYVTSQT